MYRIRISGLGFIHKQWKDEEPRFCTAKTKAKTWKSLKNVFFPELSDEINYPSKSPILYTGGSNGFYVHKSFLLIYGRL